jgi:hypothetical protein
MREIKNGNWFLSLVCLGILLLILVGCDPYDRQFGMSDLESPDTGVRIMAIKWAGDNKVTEAVPRLVDFLHDEDRAVRLYSIEALRRITGTDYGYDYKSEPAARIAAIKRWRRFIDSKKLHNGKN